MSKYNRLLKIPTKPQTYCITRVNIDMLAETIARGVEQGLSPTKVLLVNQGIVLACASYLKKVERIKRRYFAYLKEAKRHSEPTVDAVAKALARFEADTKHRDFKLTKELDPEEGRFSTLVFEKVTNK